MAALATMQQQQQQYQHGGGSSSFPTSTTASGLLAMLNESDPALRSAALTRLLAVVDTLWHEVAEALPDLEALAEDSELDVATRQTAAAVASRVFFHLEEPTQALRLALESGERNFDVVGTAPGGAGRRSAYVEALVEAAIEAYVKQRRRARRAEQLKRGGRIDDDDDVAGAAAADDDEEGGDGGGGGQPVIDMAKLQKVLFLMFERCYRDGEFPHALGVALEAREVDKFQQVLQRCRADATPDVTVKTLHYALYACVNLVASKTFRIEALEVVGEQLATLPHDAMDWAALCQCHQLLNRPSEVAKTVEALLDGTEDEALLGYQLCFDLVDSGDENFIDRVAQALPKRVVAAAASGDAPAPAAAAEGDAGANRDATAGVAANVTGAVENGVPSSAKDRPDDVWGRFEKAERILVGGFPAELALSFLHKNSDSDKLIMENLKKKLEEKGGRNSVLHNCAVLTHAYLNAGTTNDSFLRDHLDWMRKASNWAKFSATASLGVLHAGHTSEAMTLLEPYLPAVDGGASVSTTGGYSEGGSLFALGLIHGSNAGCSSAKRRETCDYLRNHLRTSHANEVISHGAALGVGLTAFGSKDGEVVNELKELLYTDSAVSGEAAGMAIGLVLIGSGFGGSGGSPPTAGAAGTISNAELVDVIGEMKNYARETQHEKIIRGIAMGLALISYGQEENADATIEEMRGDRDPIIRYGAQYALALAYVGTGSNKAIRILLHTAVSDVSDDVRMAAVIGLAFVLYKTPERVPQLVKLLLESFNPHVRFASCMAVGIAMAGTGDSESVALLEPMINDMTDFVRQGALIGTSMIYMQQSDTANGKKIKSFREKLTTIVGDKHMSTLTKMGAILGTGVMDAGGRNCSLELGSRNGFTKTTSAVGMVLWLQYWHWFPMMHMLSLALSPTFTIGLNKDFKYPKSFEIQCHSKPSAFAYPKKIEEKKEEKKKRVETVTLSTTAKNKARLARKKAKEEAESGETAAMDVEKKEVSGGEGREAEEKKETPDSESHMDVDGSETEDKKSSGEEKKAKKKREAEPTSFRVSNPSRITRSQAEVCAFDLSQRYRPVRPEGKPYGVLMLTDTTPGEIEEELGTVKTPYLEDEAEPPEPFEWAPPGHPDAGTEAKE